MAKAKKLNRKEIEAVESGFLGGYDVNWLRKLRADETPHPDADHLIEEFDALVARHEPAAEVENEELSETPDEGENIEN